jgi:hypothetical protein
MKCSSGSRDDFHPQRNGFSRFGRQYRPLALASSSSFLHCANQAWPSGVLDNCGRSL